MPEDEDAQDESARVLFVMDNSKRSQELLNSFLSPNRLFERPEVHISTIFDPADSGIRETCPELAERVSNDRYEYVGKLMSTYVSSCLRRGYICKGSIIEEKSSVPFESILQKAEEVDAKYIYDARYVPEGTIKVIGTKETFMS